MTSGHEPIDVDSDDNEEPLGTKVRDRHSSKQTTKDSNRVCIFI